MTDLERAIAYIRIFVNVGAAWRSFVPVDADIVTADSIRIGDVALGPGEGGRWWVKDLTLGTTSWYARAAS